MLKEAGGHRSRIGAGLVLCGLLVNPWTIAYALTSDGSVDRTSVATAIAFFSAACVLGGLQLLWRWVEPIAWGRQVGLVRATIVVAGVAALAAGTYWRIATFGLRHSHLTMVDTGHSGVTPEQQQWADDFYKRSLAAALKHGWFDFDTAMAQGFQVDRVNRTHFPNQQYLFDDVELDPERPEWLIYYQSETGPTLMGFMFFTRELYEKGPTPAGTLAQWHFHPFDRPRCAIKSLWSVSRPDENGVCAEGELVWRSPEMLHVWFIDHPLGRFTEMNVIPESEPSGFALQHLHPIAVHFAIALFLIGVLVDVFAQVVKKEQYHWVGWVNLALAAVACVTAVAAGLEAELVLSPTHQMHQTLDPHRSLGYASLATVLVLFAWRYALRGGFPQRGAVLYLVVSLAGAGLVVGTGYYGGEMVYRHGAGVTAVDQFARERYWREVRQVYNPRPGETSGDAPASGHEGNGPSPHAGH